MPLTLSQAEHFARLPLAGLEREYPNHIMHLLNGPEDVRSPHSLHPIFYGCFDWHSAVHGYWLLVRCLVRFPELAQRQRILELFQRSITASHGEMEADYFQQPGRISFERPYGWAWLLKLAAELRRWEEPRARGWRAALEPLVALLRRRLIDFLPRQDYPIRVGTHYNTAFAMILALDHARAEGDYLLEATVRDVAHRYYDGDREYPSHYEPGGDDFLSGALTEALLMSALLGQHDFVDWFDRFLPDLAGERGRGLLDPVAIGDCSDPKIVHLDGLHLSRAWCLRELAKALPASHPAQTAIRQGAERLAAASLPHVASGDYGGEHWLATFAMLAVEAE